MSPSIELPAARPPNCEDCVATPACARFTMPAKILRPSNTPLSTSSISTSPSMSTMPSIMLTPANVPSSSTLITPSSLTSYIPFIISTLLMSAGNVVVITCERLRLTIGMPGSPSSSTPSLSVSKNTTPDKSNTSRTSA